MFLCCSFFYFYSTTVLRKSVFLVIHSLQCLDRYLALCNICFRILCTGLNQNIGLVIQLECSIKSYIFVTWMFDYVFKFPLLRCNSSWIPYVSALLAIKDGYCPSCADLLHIESTLKILYQLPQLRETLVTDLHNKNDFSLWKLVHSTL